MRNYIRQKRIAESCWLGILAFCTGMILLDRMWFLFSEQKQNKNEETAEDE